MHFSTHRHTGVHTRARTRFSTVQASESLVSMTRHEDLFYKAHCVRETTGCREHLQPSSDGISFPASFANRYEEKAQFLCLNTHGCLMQMNAEKQCNMFD